MPQHTSVDDIALVKKIEINSVDILFGRGNKKIMFRAIYWIVDDGFSQDETHFGWGSAQTKIVRDSGYGTTILKEK